MRGFREGFVPVAHSKTLSKPSHNPSFLSMGCLQTPALGCNFLSSFHGDNTLEVHSLISLGFEKASKTI